MGKMANSITRMVMQNEMKGTTTKGDANSEIKTYTLSAEELSKYRALPVPPEEKQKTNYGDRR